MNVQPLPEVSPAFAARMGLLLPTIVILGRGLHANVERPIGLGAFRFEFGSDLTLNVLFGLLALGAIGAARTALMGPSRWKGLVGLALVAVALFAPTTALEIPALRRLGS